MKGLFAEQRTWRGLGILAAVLIVIAGWFTLISPMRADTAFLASQEADARDQNAVLTHKIVVLKQQAEGLPALRTALGTQLRGLPTSSGLPELTRQLSDQATASRVGVKSVAVGAITPVRTAAAGTATGAGGTASATAAAGQLFAIPITITTTGPAKGQIAFLKAIQQVGPRRALVVSTQFAPGAAASAATVTAPAATSIDTDSTMTTVLTVFSAPISPAEQTQLNRLLAGTSTS